MNHPYAVYCQFYCCYVVHDYTVNPFTWTPIQIYNFSYHHLTPSFIASRLFLEKL
jgi:hypothetical protein